MNIAILGFGIEGRSAYRYLHKLNKEHKIDIFDQKTIQDTDVEVTKVNDFLDIDFSSYGAIVRSPSIRPDDIYEKIISDKSGSKDFNLTSATQIFFDKCSVPIIGVTGTKGKGTTCSLITEIIKAEGRRVHLVGNIGISALDILNDIQPDDIVVYELSSFQLWNLRKSPHVAVVVHMEPDHQDIHKDLVEYVEAKSNIATHQSDNDFIVFDSANKDSTTIADKSAAKKIPYPSNMYANIRDGQFYFGEQFICSVDKLLLPGEHNRMNALAAISASYMALGDMKGDSVANGLSSFSGLKHRLKLVDEIGGREYYDDSISTTPGSTIAAIKAFDSPEILILGGSSKGVSLADLMDFIVTNKNIKRVILIGTEAAVMETMLEERSFTNFINLGFSTDMRGIVDLATKISGPDDKIILSPACASFDMFDSYADRGDKFITAVSLAKEKHDS
jgi:UDP-N-acetylmuramoylalanine--D-glutamate ligase